LFENFVILELMKSQYNKALSPLLYYYRDVSGKEIDLILQKGSRLIPIEIKSSKTFSPSFLEGLEYFHKQAQVRAMGGALVYGGELTQKICSFALYNLENCIDLMHS
jgi:predicted AAA+ superfamily ATPase